MRWARRILIAISVVVALLGVAILLLVTIDLSRFKSNLEVYVSNATGRKFVIAGIFEPSIGSTIEIVAEDVRLANADWGLSENILELERIVIRIDTWSLLSGPTEILNLDLEGLAVHVEEDRDTLQSSWSFGEAIDDIDDQTGEPFELPLWLHQARLQRVNITYGQGWLDAPRKISINDAKLSSDESELLNITLSGAAGDDPLSAEGLIGPLSALLNGRGPRWELEVSIGHFLASIDGTFRNLFSLEGPEIHVAMQGPLAERLLDRFGLPPIARGPVNLTGELVESAGGVELRVQGAFGDLMTDVTGRAEALKTIGNLNLSVDLRGPNLQAIGELFDAEFLPPVEFSVAGDGAVAGNTLHLQSMIVSAGDTSLEFNGKLAPKAIDPDAQLRLSASGSDIRQFLPATIASRIPSGAFSLQAIAAGPLQHPQLQQLSAMLAEHQLSLEGNAPIAADFMGLNVSVAARGPDLDQIIGPWTGNDIVAEPYVLGARISNTGAGFVVRDLTFDLASTKLKMTGSSGTLPTFASLDATIELDGDDLQATFESWFDVALPAVAFSLDGSFNESNGALTLSDVTYRLGNASGKIDGTTGILPSLDGLSMTTSLSGPDASRFVAQFGNLEDSAAVPAIDFESHGSFSRRGATWYVETWMLRLGDSRIEMSGTLGNLIDPSGFDVDIAASGPDLREYFADSAFDSPVPYDLTGGMRLTDMTIELDEVNVRIGEATAWLDGRLPIGEEMTNAEFDVRIAGPNLHNVGQAIGVAELPATSFQLEGAFQRDGQAYVVNDLMANVGESDLSGDFRLQLTPNVQLSGDIESNNLNLVELLGAPEEIAGGEQSAPKPDRVIPDTELPLDALEIAAVDVTARFRQLVTRNFGARDIELVVSIEPDEMHIRTREVASSHGGTLSGKLDVVRNGVDQADVAIELVARQFQLRPRFENNGSAINRPAQDLDLNLSGSGRTLRDLAASANGTIDLRIGAGEIDNNFSGYMMRDMLSQVFAAINPFSKDSTHTQLNCGFAKIDVVDGVAISQAVGLQTDKLAAASVGTVNLGTEALDLYFRVKQRQGIGISLAGVVNPFVKVGGTLASPALTIDKKRGVITGTVAVLTGGLSILYKGVWDRYLSRDDYCQAVIDALESGEIPVWEGD